MRVPEDFKRSGIYQIRCLVNEKVYIGSAKKFWKRWTLHKNQLCAGIHHSVHLQRAWDKYGEGEFAFEVREFVDDLDGLVEAEQRHLDEVKPHLADVGFNCSPSANSSLGIKRRPETLVKMAEVRRGKKHTDATKEKVRASSTGRWHTEESKRKMSELAKGRVISPEQRAKISAKLTGRKASPEARAKLSAARMGNKNSLGRVHPPEIRAKISAAGMGRRKSPDSIAKCQATWSAKKKIRLAHGDHPGGRIAERSLGLELMAI